MFQTFAEGIAYLNLSVLQVLLNKWIYLTVFSELWLFLSARPVSSNMQQSLKYFNSKTLSINIWKQQPRSLKIRPRLLKRILFHKNQPEGNPYVTTALKTNHNNQLSTWKTASCDNLAQKKSHPRTQLNFDLSISSVALRSQWVGYMWKDSTEHSYAISHKSLFPTFTAEKKEKKKKAISPVDPLSGCPPQSVALNHPLSC